MHTTLGYVDGEKNEPQVALVRKALLQRCQKPKNLFGISTNCLVLVAVDSETSIGHMKQLSESATHQ
jgi:hypothetical protein